MMETIFKPLDNLSESHSGVQLLYIEAQEKESKIDYQKLFDEMKELSEYSLTHSDVLYSDKGL